MDRVGITDGPVDDFTRHLSDCTSGCDVRLDGTGPLCPEGVQVMQSLDWEALSRSRDRAQDTLVYLESKRLLARLQAS